MNIFQQLNKLPTTDINEVSYGKERILSNSFHEQRSHYFKVFEGKTYLEWAEHYGISYSTIRDRMRLRGTPHPKGPLYSETTTYKGKPPNWWGKKLGVTSECIRYRMIKYGTPFLKKGTTYEGKKLHRWAEELGISYNLVYMRIKAGKHPSDNERTNAVFYEGKAITQWAEELNVDSTTISRRIQAGKHPAERSRRILKVDKDDK